MNRLQGEQKVRVSGRQCKGPGVAPAPRESEWGGVVTKGMVGRGTGEVWVERAPRESEWGEVVRKGECLCVPLVSLPELQS